MSALSILKEFQRDFNPLYSVNLGDLMTLDQISRFDNDCDIQTKTEWEMGNALLDFIPTTHLCLGNHDFRGFVPGRLPKNQREDYNPVTRLHLNRRKIKFVPYHNEKGMFKFGKLTALHGYACPEHVAKAHAMTYGCVVHGHAHRSQTFQPKHAFVKNTGFSLGCMCKLDLDYVTFKLPSGWSQSFGFAYIMRNGHFSFYEARLIGNDVIINDKTYSRPQNPPELKLVGED